jgi:hypothetical protein
LRLIIHRLIGTVTTNATDIDANSPNQNPGDTIVIIITPGMISSMILPIISIDAIDTVIVRLLAVLLLLPGGLPGFVPYLVMWIVIPARPKK